MEEEERGLNKKNRTILEFYTVWLIKEGYLNNVLFEYAEVVEEFNLYIQQIREELKNAIDTDS